MKTLYAGSFDPITNGHEWMIRNAPGELVVAVANNPFKKYMFSLDKRIDLVARSILGVREVHVMPIGNLYLAEFAKQIDADYIIRGIRNVDDYKYEREFAIVNRDIAFKPPPHLFLMPPPALEGVSSSMVKALVGPDGWEQVVSKYVSPCVLEALR